MEIKLLDKEKMCFYALKEYSKKKVPDRKIRKQISFLDSYLGAKVRISFATATSAKIYLLTESAVSVSSELILDKSEAFEGPQFSQKELSYFCSIFLTPHAISRGFKTGPKTFLILYNIVVELECLLKPVFIWFDLFSNSVNFKGPQVSLNNAWFNSVEKEIRELFESFFPSFELDKIAENIRLNHRYS